MKAGVIDAAKVTRSALQNAASIAALFLTTEAVVADKPEKEGAAGGMPGGMPGWAAWETWTSKSCSAAQRSQRGALRGAPFASRARPFRLDGRIAWRRSLRVRRDHEAAVGALVGFGIVAGVRGADCVRQRQARGDAGGVDHVAAGGGGATSQVGRVETAFDHAT